GQVATASCRVEIMEAISRVEPIKAIAYEEKKMLPPPAEIDKIKRDLVRIQSLLDREMKKGTEANRARIDKLLKMRDDLQEKLRELRKK
ncbi:MAG: hypothetical protein N3G19_03400, partial [Candidatus Pacearchaeota archaeon]|nr:hypothetical protein [Candidatus Pacearchaeota archaeon]